MSDIPGFPYRLLWGERTVTSVANLTRADGLEFMRTAENVDLAPAIERFALADANDALARLRNGELRGAAVLSMALTYARVE
jgi:propanol-preferring alcohol dehydrogenase